MKSELRQLAAKLSYYYAADGEQARREILAKMEHEAKLRQFCQQYSQKDLEEAWPEDVYLVDKNDFIFWGKE